MKKFSLGLLLMCTLPALAQLTQKLKSATDKFQLDTQLRHATMSLLVIDATTGKRIFEKNAGVGLAPASTQKLFTSVAAFDLLGADYRYKTVLKYNGNINSGGILSGNLFLIGSGDPTLGSWRWQQTNPDSLYSHWMQALKEKKITNLDTGSLIIINPGFSEKIFPDGWIWQDIGNYYGARPAAFNWRENQFDVLIDAGVKENDPARIAGFVPDYLHPYALKISELSTGAKGSGDNAYLYIDPNNEHSMFLAGTVPAMEKNFSISAAHPDPERFFSDFLQSNVMRATDSSAAIWKRVTKSTGITKPDTGVILYTHYSPTLDSINYWFLKKSINLYGEALLRTISYEKKGFGSTDGGVAILQDFWSKHGIETSALNIIDGSGLSPQNRVTAEALVQAISYARTRPWYASFYNALPLINGMHMKSGSIGGARTYAGIQKSSDGHEYIFAFMINNYDGSSGAIVQKMWKVLDVLK